MKLGINMKDLIKKIIRYFNFKKKKKIRYKQQVGQGFNNQRF